MLGDGNEMTHSSEDEDDVQEWDSGREGGSGNSEQTYQRESGSGVSAWLPFVWSLALGLSLNNIS